MAYIIDRADHEQQFIQSIRTRGEKCFRKDEFHGGEGFVEDDVEETITDVGSCL